MKNPIRAIAFVLFSLVSMTSGVEKYTPTSQYKELRILDHAILLHPELDKHPEERKRMEAELELQLGNIHKVLSKEKLKHLAGMRIWIEWNQEPRSAAVFHPDAGWLKSNGYNPDKADNIEICNTKNFIQWSKSGQPWMLMHEFSHAYHENVLKSDYKPIQQAYERAMKDKLYDSVDDLKGKKVKAYAATDGHEFFSEMTEAYLGKNDFYPFTREDLKKHDPKTYELMMKIWDK